MPGLCRPGGQAGIYIRITIPESSTTTPKGDLKTTHGKAMQRSSITIAHLFPPHLIDVASVLRIVNDSREFERLPATQKSAPDPSATDPISDAKYV